LQYAEGVAFKVFLEERRLVARREMPHVELEECEQLEVARVCF
jgi:hypothetical protein